MLACALVLTAVPASPVLAGNAGTDQYVDPLDRTQSPGGGNGSGSQAGGSGQFGQAAGISAGSGANGRGGSLPRTGEDAWQVALLGVALLAGGVALRRGLRARS